MLALHLALEEYQVASWKITIVTTDLGGLRYGLIRPARGDGEI